VSPELEDIRREMERLTRDWSEVDWHAGPPGKWNTGQILQHLLLTYTGTTRGLLNLMNSGRLPASKPRWEDSWKAFWVTRMGYMPAGAKATTNLTPSGGLDPTSLRRFYDALVAMDAMLSDAERRFGRGVKLMMHPFLGPLDAADWRRFHRTHSRHHMKQIRQALRHAPSHTPDHQVSR